MLRLIGIAAVAALGVTSTAWGTAVPFVENFAQDSAGWRDGSGGTDLQWVAAGGPDGSSYASGMLNFAGVAPNGTPLVARAQEEWNSSDNAFVGNYLADQVESFQVWVRHDSPVPLTYFVRFSGPANFPGAIALQFAPVLPNTWTPITVAIDPANPQFVNFEGSDFDTVFSNVGHVQLALFEPAALAGQDLSFNFDVDQPRLTGGASEPVPAVTGQGLALLMIVLSTAVALRFRRQTA